MVVIGDLKHALAWHITPSQNVFEEGNNIGGLFRPAESNQENRVVSQRLLPGSTIPGAWHLFLRRRGALTFSKTRHAPPTFGPDHLLGMIFGILRLESAR